MKLFCAAVALTLASPAFAQADPHAGHSPAAHQAAQQAQGGHDAHAGHKGAEHKGHGGHKDCCKDGEAKMPCCEKARAAGKKMPCCEKHEAKDAKPAQDHSGH